MHSANFASDALVQLATSVILFLYMLGFQQQVPKNLRDSTEVQQIVEWIFADPPVAEIRWSILSQTSQTSQSHICQPQLVVQEVQLPRRGDIPMIPYGPGWVFSATVDSVDRRSQWTLQFLQFGMSALASDASASASLGRVCSPKSWARNAGSISRCWPCLRASKSSKLAKVLGKNMEKPWKNHIDQKTIQKLRTIELLTCLGILTVVGVLCSLLGLPAASGWRQENIKHIIQETNTKSA